MNIMRLPPLPRQLTEEEKIMKEIDEEERAAELIKIEQNIKQTTEKYNDGIEWKNYEQRTRKKRANYIFW